MYIYIYIYLHIEYTISIVFGLPRPPPLGTEIL